MKWQFEQEHAVTARVIQRLIEKKFSCDFVANIAAEACIIRQGEHSALDADALLTKTYDLLFRFKRTNQTIQTFLDLRKTSWATIDELSQFIDPLFGTHDSNLRGGGLFHEVLRRLNRYNDRRTVEIWRAKKDALLIKNNEQRQMKFQTENVWKAALYTALLTALFTWIVSWLPNKQSTQLKQDRQVVIVEHVPQYQLCEVGASHCP